MRATVGAIRTYPRCSRVAPPTFRRMMATDMVPYALIIAVHEHAMLKAAAVSDSFQASVPFALADQAAQAALDAPPPPKRVVETARRLDSGAGFLAGLAGLGIGAGIGAANLPTDASGWDVAKYLGTGGLSGAATGVALSGLVPAGYGAIQAYHRSQR